MKKLFSILLALVMVFSLTVPAFASGSIGIIGGADGPTAIITSPGFTVPEPDDYGDEDYVQWIKSYWAEICAEYPEETTQFVTEVQAWYPSSYYSILFSYEEYVSSCNCVEEVYVNLFWDWMSYREQEQARQAFITSHGGVAGQINVMVNGRYVTFPDAVPELTGGRTMVPFRAIFEALGAEISYDEGKIHAALGDIALDLTIGADTMTKTAGGKTTTIQMDCAPYLKGGRTYVPVRFISEALGYDVQWDDYYQSAVITDLDALAAKIDEQFTVYNKLAAQSALTDKTQKTTGSGRVDVTLFDTLNGDKTGKGTLSYDLAASTSGASGKVEYDLSQLWSLIEGYIPVPLDDYDYGYDYAGEYAQTLELVKSLMKGSMEVRVDLEKGKAYLSMPSLFEAMNSYMAESGVQLPKNAWLSADLSDGEAPDLTALMSQVSTMGKLLTGLGSSGYRPAENYENTLEAAEQFAKLYGDAKFKRQGSSYVLTMTKEDLLDLMGEGYTMEDLSSLTKFELTMTVKDNGDADVSYQMRIALADSEIDLGDFMDLSAKATTRSGKTDCTMEMHIKNVLKATITLQEKRTETNTAPTVTPPSDALVLPADGTLGDIPQ